MDKKNLEGIEVLKDTFNQNEELSRITVENLKLKAINRRQQACLLKLVDMADTHINTQDKGDEDEWAENILKWIGELP